MVVNKAHKKRTNGCRHSLLIWCYKDIDRIYLSRD